MKVARNILVGVVVPILLLTIGFLAGRISAPEDDSGPRITSADVDEAYGDGFDDGYSQALSETLAETSNLATELATLFSADPAPGMVRGSVVTYQDEGGTICLNLDDTDAVACGPLDLFEIASTGGAPVGAEVLIQEGPDHSYILSVWGESE